MNFTRYVFKPTGAIFLIFSFILIIFFLEASAPVKIFAKSYKSNGAVSAGAEIIYKKVSVKLDSKYRMKIKVAESVKILNRRGIDKYSEVIIPFSLKYQRIKLLKAFTEIGGKFKIPVRGHAINVVSPDIAVNYPSYSSIKYLTLSMPAVEPGAVINFSYVIDYYKPLIEKSAFYTDYMSGPLPAKNISFTLSYPHNMKVGLFLRRIPFHLVNKNKEIINGKRYIKVTIALHDSKTVKKEPYMPPMGNYEKFVSFSTYASWNNLLLRLNKKFQSSEKINKNIKKFVDNISAGNNVHTGESAIISRIYRKFVQSFRYVGIGYGINGYDPENATVTFSNGYGDSKSLASLLVTMLRARNIDAFPVLAVSLKSPDFNKNVLSPKQFDLVIVGVKYNGKIFFLYPGSSSYKAFTLPFILSGRKAVALFNNGGFKFISLPVQKADQNKKLFIFNGNIHKTGKLNGEIESTYSGAFDIFRRKTLKNEEIYDKKNQIYDFLYNFLPGSELSAYHIKNINKVDKNIIFKLVVDDKDYGLIKGDKIVFKQVIPYDNSLLKFISKKSRIYPLLTGYPFTDISMITVKLPKNSEIYFLPPALKLSNNAGSAYGSCRMEKYDDLLRCRFKFESVLPVIPVKDYDNYRKLVEGYLSYLKNYFVVISSIYFYQY